MLQNSIKERLDSINWNFEKRKIVDKERIFPFNNRKYYSYPATFIPEIPFTLIEILSKPMDVVFDPFGGIGTTLIQAIIQNRIPISLDNNLIAYMITKDFYDLFSPYTDLLDGEKKILEIIGNYESSVDYKQLLSGSQHDLVGWYDEYTMNELAYLIITYNQIKCDLLFNKAVSLYHLCLTNLLTTVSSQNGGWAYIADNVKPKKDKIIYKNALERFKFNISQCVKCIQDYKIVLGNKTEKIYSANGINSVLHGDIKSFDVKPMLNSVDLVVTSPPYPKMIDYVKSQRLSFCVENASFVCDAGTEIGARFRRNQKGTVEEYVSDMMICNERIYQCLKEGGYLCYILPSFSCSSEENERLQAIEKIIEDCEKRGLKKVHSIERTIPGTRRSSNLKWASLRKEQIVIMEK